MTRSHRETVLELCFCDAPRTETMLRADAHGLTIYGRPCPARVYLETLETRVGSLDPRRRQRQPAEGTKGFDRIA